MGLGNQLNKLRSHVLVLRTSSADSSAFVISSAMGGLWDISYRATAEVPSWMRAGMNQHSRSVSVIGENSFTKSGSIRLETICTTDMVLSGHSKL
jgi:hypothetical protein